MKKSCLKARIGFIKYFIHYSFYLNRETLKKQVSKEHKMSGGGG